MTARRLVSSGSRFEPEIGFSRAVRVGAHISVAGTAPVSATDGNAALGDVYGQIKRCLEIIGAAIAEAGGALQDVTRTRVMLVDMTTWREAARAHGAHFGTIRPACTFAQVSRFIDPQWLVEIEADAIVLRTNVEIVAAVESDNWSCGVITRAVWEVIESRRARAPANSRVS